MKLACDYSCWLKFLNAHAAHNKLQRARLCVLTLNAYFSVYKLQFFREHFVMLFVTISLSKFHTRKYKQHK